MYIEDIDGEKDNNGINLRINESRQLHMENVISDGVMQSKVDDAKDRILALEKENQQLKSIISQHKHIKNELNKAKAKAEKLNQIKSDFLAMMSHD